MRRVCVPDRNWLTTRPVCQEEWIVLARIIYRWPIVRDIESSASVGKVKRAAAFRHRVIAAGFEQARRARMIGDRCAGSGIFAVARPEYAELLRDLLVGDARIVGHSPLARHPQLLEDLARIREREPSGPAERLGNVLDDAPILSRVSRTLDRLVDLDDPALDLGHRPFVFLLQAPRQHHIRVPWVSFRKKSIAAKNSILSRQPAMKLLSVATPWG